MVQTPALELIDNALAGVAAGDRKRLIVSMPPQEGKSERVTHYGALWLFIQDSSLRIAVVSFEADIARRWGQAIRTDIRTFDGTDGELDLGLRIRYDSAAAGRWQLEGQRGGLYAVGIGGALTGRPVDVLIIDDPIKDDRAAQSEPVRDAAWQWWLSVGRTRLAPGAPVIVITTRWHEDDLVGRLLAHEAEVGPDIPGHRWQVINVPAQADHDPDKGETDLLDREPGEFMVSARGRSDVEWQAIKVGAGSRVWNALYQGRPSPEDGVVLLRSWWRFYDRPMWSDQGDGSLHCPDVDEVIQSWDMTFKDTKGSDFVVGQVWARRGAEAFLLDQVRARLDFPATVNAFTALSARWPQAIAKLVEDKANGPAVIAQLRTSVSGMVPISPKDSKLARANAVSPFAEAGNVWLPSASLCPWVNGFIDEAAAFPNAPHDDQVDAMSQALARLLLMPHRKRARLTHVGRVAPRPTEQRVDVA